MTPFKPVTNLADIEIWLNKEHVRTLIDKLFVDKGIANAYRTCLARSDQFSDPKQWERLKSFLGATSGARIDFHEKLEKLFSLLQDAANECQWYHKYQFEIGKSAIAIGLVCKLLRAYYPCKRARTKLWLNVMQVDSFDVSVLRHASKRQRKVIGNNKFELDIVEVYDKGGRTTEVKSYPSKASEKLYAQLGRYLFVHDFNSWNEDKPCFSGLRQTLGMASLLRKTVNKFKNKSYSLNIEDFIVIGWDY